MKANVSVTREKALVVEVISCNGNVVDSNRKVNCPRVGTIKAWTPSGFLERFQIDRRDLPVGAELVVAVGKTQLSVDAHKREACLFDPDKFCFLGTIIR